MNDYENYLQQQYAMPIEDMNKCYNLLITEVQDEIAKELYRDLIENAIRYASYRANWMLWDKEKQMNEDMSRSHCHDGLIDKFNILARHVRDVGYEAEWRNMLGDIAIEPTYRKKIGDFACYLVFVNCLGAR